MHADDTERWNSLCSVALGYRGLSDVMCKLLSFCVSRYIAYPFEVSDTGQPLLNMVNPKKPCSEFTFCGHHQNEVTGACLE